MNAATPRRCRITTRSSTILKARRSPRSPILHTLIVKSSLPLVGAESVFAADSTGFTGRPFIRWHDIKYRGKREHEWVKPHLMCGVNTHIVTDVVILDRDAADVRQLPALLKTTAQNFTVREVLADKVYNVVYNQKAISEIGAAAYIPFKLGHTGRRGGVWERAFLYYTMHQEEFYRHYHQRSNIESAIMMIKSKFGSSIRSKTELPMINEVLCKILCHNICCLIKSIYELKIDRSFVFDPARK
jgi:transposase